MKTEDYMMHKLWMLRLGLAVNLLSFGALSVIAYQLSLLVK